MDRAEMWGRARDRREAWDLLVIGGGATGVGVALDAAARGYAVLLVERDDFGKGTSSRSTKLVHGGVRYLARGEIGLVREALRERSILRRNAPGMVLDLTFVIPGRRRRDVPYYGLGLKAYDFLAGRSGFGPSRLLSKSETLAILPGLKADGLRGGVAYHDGQFDDARLLIGLVMTAAGQGATVLNYAPATALLKDTTGRVVGATIVDAETGESIEVRARVVVNATGAFSDEVRRLADPEAGATVAASRGSHVVLDASFLPGRAALMVPKTSDGRVMFAIPWSGRTLLGTTDVPVAGASAEPVASDEEVDFLLGTAATFLERKPTRADVLSVFAGIRPLVKVGGGGTTAALARDHAIRVDAPGLVSIAGGKWTTYRSMAEGCVDRAASLAGLPARPCPTRDLPIVGGAAPPVQSCDADRLDPRLPVTEADIRRAARGEMARTVEDVLSRRTRALVLDARAAVAIAPKVAQALAGELGRDDAWTAGQVEAFAALARGYRIAEKPSTLPTTDLKP